MPVLGRLISRSKLVEGQLAKHETNIFEHGYVRVIYEDESYYEGFMLQGKYNGNGTLHLSNGTKVSGYWSNGTNFAAKEFYDLGKLFNSTPSSNLSQNILDTW